jgi:integrase
VRTLLEICESEYFVLNLKIRSPHTIYQYGIALRCFARSLGHEPTTADLHDDAITLWMGRLLRQTDPPLSVNTVRERVNRVLALWTWLAKRTVGMRWPTVVKPPAPETLPTALSEDQLRRLFKSAGKERGTILGIPAELWWVSYLAFVYNTAERKTAALSVKVAWLDLEQGTATIPPGVRKGGRKWGTYRLWPESLPLLRACLDADPRRELMWPWPKCKQSYYVSYDRILRDAGIPVDRWHKTHSLRVSHATWLKVVGGDPTRKLMHDSAETTERHYIDPRHLPDSDHRLFVPWGNDR